ncbi:MAG: polysaccharide deacetylase family protein, partial [Clostridia bacterium]|nr:polysaccharide deacetylase family protein [Clostridia bacterium]
LKEENVPAAFFVLENLVTRNTDLVKRMAEEGHLVCNHTARHGDMSAASKEEFTRELETMERVYRDTTGSEIARYYRPPEGKFSRDNLMWAEEMGYRTVFWSCAYADWDNGRQMEPDAAKEKLLSGTHNGEVLLLHPTSSTNAAILADLIREWRDMGYRFGTLDELCGK